MAGGAVGGPIAAAGTILGAFDKYRTAQTEAAQLEQNATQAFAASQRTFLQTQRQVALVQSKVRSIAGASGAGAQDVGVQNLQADIARSGEYDALSALYSGESEARSLKMQAAADRQAGTNALLEGVIGGGADIAAMPSRTTSSSDNMAALTTAGSGLTLFDRYAGKLPDWLGVG